MLPSNSVTPARPWAPTHSSHGLSSPPNSLQQELLSVNIFHLLKCGHSFFWHLCNQLLFLPHILLPFISALFQTRTFCFLDAFLLHGGFLAESDKKSTVLGSERRPVIQTDPLRPARHLHSDDIIWCPIASFFCSPPLQCYSPRSFRRILMQ